MVLILLSLSNFHELDVEIRLWYCLDAFDCGSIVDDVDCCDLGSMLVLTKNAAVTHRQQGSVESECTPWQLQW